MEKSRGFERTIEDVIEKMKHERSSGTPCRLLIGAGCSVSAGISAGPGIVKRISEDYKQAYDRVLTVNLVLQSRRRRTGP